MFQVLATSQAGYDALATAAMQVQLASAMDGFAVQPAVDVYVPPADVMPQVGGGLDRISAYDRLAAGAPQTLWLSPTSDDTPTKPPSSGGGAPPAGGGSPPGNGGDGSNSAVFNVSALSAFYALQSIRDRHNVYLDEEGLGEALADYNLIDWITNESRAMMKTVLAELKEKKDELDALKSKLAEKEAQGASLDKYINSKVNEISSLILKGVRSALERKKAELRVIAAEIDELRKIKRDLEPKMARITILEEWLGRMARSDYHDAYACITDKGLAVLKKMEGDQEALKDRTFVDFMISLNR